MNTELAAPVVASPRTDTEQTGKQRVAAGSADAPGVPALSSSIAHILLSRSALHAWHAHPRLNPNYQPEESADFDYGTAAHSLLLEKDESRLVVVEADDWRKKDAQELRKAARAEGKQAILARQVKKLRTMVEAARDAIYASELADAWDRGESEVKLHWQEGQTHCRSRLDRLSGDKRIIMDYKSCASAHPDAVLRSIVNFGYDMQEAFYRRGVKALHGLEPAFVFVCQEKDAPYACSMVALDPAMQEMADRKVSYALALWARCMETGKWAGYGNRIAYVAPPAWYAAQVEEWAGDDELSDRMNP